MQPVSVHPTGSHHGGNRTAPWACRRLLAAMVGLAALFGLLTPESTFLAPVADSHRLLASQKQSSEGADGAPQLRYGWKGGQTIVYSVTIEADRGDYTETLKGTPQYTVRSANMDEIRVGFQGTLTRIQQRKDGAPSVAFRPRFGPPLRRPRRPPLPPFGNVGIGSLGLSHDLVINRRGQLVSIKGSSQLPHLLGNLCQLMIETLPEGNEKTWEESSDVAITESLSRLPYSMLFRESEERSTIATEKTVYSIQEVTKEKAVIKKAYELKSAATVGGKPKYAITGTGTLTFDLEQGTPAALEFEQRVITREGNITEETPVKVSYKLVDEAERKRLAEAAEAARKEAAKPLDAASRKEVLADLKSDDPRRVSSALLRLQQKAPEKPDDEMAAAIAAGLENERSASRYMAARALEKWATSKTVPALLKLLDDDSITVRMSAMKALGRLKVQKTAEPIAAKLTSTSDRFAASQGLQEMGPAGESAVLKYLDHDEWQVRYEVCKILEKIGTKKSVAALKKALDDSNSVVQMTAKRALEKIERRK